MITLEVDIRDATAALAALGMDAEVQVEAGLDEIGRTVQATAKEYCPISPTKDQAKGAPYRHDKGKAPGTLQEAIEMWGGPKFRDVGIRHGPARLYADYIHNRRGIDWIWRGPGTRAKGPLARERFIDRAAKHHEKEMQRVFDRYINRAISRHNSE